MQPSEPHIEAAPWRFGHMIGLFANKMGFLVDI